MATGKPIFYWDTAPLIAWITDEKRSDPADMAGLNQIVQLVERGRAILITSVLWRAEVFEMGLTGAQKRRLESAFDGRNVIEVGIDNRTMDLTSEIRAYHKASKKKDVMTNVRVPDAIHLASAIQNNATEFHTFDGARKGGARGGLLTLDGNVAGRRLRICTPSADQYLLDFASRDDDSAE
jgi:hypothetical protein